MGLALKWNNGTGTADLAIEGGKLALDRGLATHVLVLLFTDRRAEPGERDEDPRGWWGKAIAPPDSWRGSRLWLALNGNAEAATADRVARAAEQALKPLVERKLASKVEASATLDAEHRLLLTTRFTRPGGRLETYQFKTFWENVL